MTDQEALQRLLQGNERFATGDAKHPEQGADRRAALTSGQAPWAIVHGCADSRVPPELLFDAGLGELFVTRVAGNVADTASIASMQYAVEHLQVPLLVVLGHSGCGAVTAALQESTPSGHLGTLVSALRAPLTATPPGTEDRLAQAVLANVRHVVAHLQSGEPTLAAAVRRGSVRVVGMVYDLGSGRVRVVA